MGRRNFHAIEELPLVSGELCLDLVNTTGARASGSPRERLRTYGDLLVWSLRARILSPDDAERLRAAAAVRMEESEAVLRHALELREELYSLFRAIVEGTEVSADTVARLGGYWREERGRCELVAEENGFALRRLIAEDELDPMVWPVIASAVDLLLSRRIKHVKRCGECDWLFADESRNGSRTWCKKECGDRARARRHYARNRRSNATE